MIVTTDIISKWDSLGFLVGLNADKKQVLSGYYESITSFIYEFQNFNKYQGLIIPVLYRIVKELPKQIQIHPVEILFELEDLYKSESADILKSLNGVFGLDFEQLFCKYIADKIILKYKKYFSSNY